MSEKGREGTSGAERKELEMGLGLTFAIGSEWSDTDHSTKMGLGASMGAIGGLFGDLRGLIGGTSTS